MFPDRFSFNSSKYNLWEIYDRIKTFYPIGIPRGSGSSLFLEYQGIKKLDDIVLDNVHDVNNYNQRWVSYTNKLGQILQKEIVGTTYGQAPSFSAYAIIEQNKMGYCTHQKELHFALSFVGKFFTIYGLDTTRIVDDINSYRGYQLANVLTASPYKEYKEDFTKLENNIRAKYPDHKMVPYAFGQQVINGLQLRYTEAEVCSVYMALFNDIIQPRNNFRFTQGHVIDNKRGDIYYGLKDWANEK